MWKITILLAVYIAGSYTCSVPKADNVDWSKFSGNWYETFHSGDPIMSKAVSCFVLGNFSANVNGGCKMDVKEYFYDGRSPVTFHTEVERKQGGVYRLSKAAGKEALARHEEAKLDSDLVREVVCGVYGGDIAYLTDYKTYMLLVTCACSPGGGYVVWGKTPTPNPSYESILPAFNALVDAGVYCRLYQSECRSAVEV